jgi:hypothetical protein
MRRAPPGARPRRKGETSRGGREERSSSTRVTRNGGMRLGSRERVALRGVRGNGGLRQARARTRGFRPLVDARPRHEAHERVRGGDARFGTRLRSSARGLRVSVRLTAAARGLLLVALTCKRERLTRGSSPRPRPGDRRRRKARLARQEIPREWEGRASPGEDRPLTLLCSRVVRVAEVGRPVPGPEKRTSARARGETSRACVGSA